MSLAASHPGILQLPDGVGKTINIVSTNSYGMPINLMFDSQSNSKRTTDDDTLVYSPFPLSFIIAQLTDNMYFLVSFVTKPRASITPAVRTATGHLTRG
jgi:hypothetical protein